MDKKAESNTELSQSESHVPLSPVLGSGQSVRKLLKNRKRSKMNPRKVVQKIDAALEPKYNMVCHRVDEQGNVSRDSSILEDFQLLEDSTNTILEPIPDPSSSKVLVPNDHESVLDRIKKLEALDLQKHNIVNTFSIGNNVIVKEEKQSLSVIKNNSFVKTLENDDFSWKTNSVIINKHCAKAMTGPIGFQTATGKDISISDVCVKSSTKLFEDILCPSTSQISRKKKYSYLHRPASCETSGVLKNSFNSNGKTDLQDDSLDTFHKPNHNNRVPKNCLIEESKDVSVAQNKFRGLDGQNSSFNENMGFKTPSITFKTKTCPSDKMPNLTAKARIKNLFEAESFDDLYLTKQRKEKNILGDPNLFQDNTVKSVLTNLGETLGQTLDKESKGIFILKNNRENNLKKIFEGENFNDLNIGEHIGFKSASATFGQVVGPNNLPQLKLNSNCDTIESKDVTPVSIKGQDLQEMSNCESSRENMLKEENFNELAAHSNCGFKSAATRLTMLETKTLDCKGKSVQGLKRKHLPETNEAKTQNPYTNIFEGENFDDLNMNFGQFKTVAKQEKNFNYNLTSSFGKADNSSKGFKNIFEGENFDDLNLPALGHRFKEFTPSKPNLLHTKGPGNFKSPLRTPIKNILLDNTNKKQSKDDLNGFSNEEQQASMNVSNDIRQMSKVIGDRFQSLVFNHISEKPLLKLNDIKNLSRNINKNKQTFGLVYEEYVANRKRKFSEVESDHNSLCENSSTSVTPLQSGFLKRSRKRLGCPFSPTIQLSDTGLKRAKLLFEDLEPKRIETSTPVKFNKDPSKQLFCDLTPIQNLANSFVKDSLSNNSNVSRTILRKSNLDSTVIGTRNRFSLKKPSVGDVRVWLENLSHERRLLQEQLRIVNEKQTILANQRTILNFSGNGKKRVVPGVLYKSKGMPSKVSLRECVPFEQTQSDNTFLDQINPQNAHLVHFNICDKRESHVKTEDGAIIVPNIEARIGLTEIEHSFKLLDGVDPSLIPKGWVRNHYKWVVWKLASYERAFRDKFEGCLSLENVVQQLKFRYDVEIDNVKRPILRKIFEKDDCSQRRMILCVSNIIRVNSSYELELTDGWYSIRTVIDLPLCIQVIKGKIKIGMKLIIYGAEIMNCEGCYPLEATDSIYLQISYNCSRRALWWCKLGPQKAAGPFLIPMTSINMEGGKIGCIRCFILRVYPVKYLEKCGDMNVWRNRKADERREQDFNNEKIKLMRSNEFNHCGKTDSDFRSYKDLKSINDPEMLYNVLQRSGDPESIQEILSTSQRTMLYNYTINRPAQLQSFGASNSTGQLLNERSVTSMLKMKIIDAAYDSDKVYDFHVWRPGEGHLQELKEGEICTIFNLSCSSKWGLSANQTTQFRRDNKPQNERFKKFRRNTTAIGELVSFSQQPHLVNEFDTVGLVIEKRIGNTQQIWMADSRQKLFFIEIFDSPKNILALDVVSEGQIVSVCNLTMKNAFATHSLAVADHSVIFARYSQHKHLQDALEKLEEEFENVDRDSYMEECRDKILRIEHQMGTKKPTLPLDMDGMECSQITITDIALLECVEKLT